MTLGHTVGGDDCLHQLSKNLERREVDGQACRPRRRRTPRHGQSSTSPATSLGWRPPRRCWRRVSPTPLTSSRRACSCRRRGRRRRRPSSGWRATSSRRRASQGSTGASRRRSRGTCPTRASEPLATRYGRAGAPAPCPGAPHRSRLPLAPPRPAARARRDQRIRGRRRGALPRQGRGRHGGRRPRPGDRRPARPAQGAHAGRRAGGAPRDPPDPAGRARGQRAAQARARRRQGAGQAALRQPGRRARRDREE